MSTMLHSGYQFEQSRPFASASKIEGVSAEWTLGAVATLPICHVPSTGSEAPRSGIYLLLLLLILSMLLMAALACPLGRVMSAAMGPSPLHGKAGFRRSWYASPGNHGKMLV